MSAECAVCGVKLGIGRRLGGKTLCETHEAEENARLEAEAEARAAARAEYVRAVVAVSSSPGVASRLPELAAKAGLGDDARVAAAVDGVSQALVAAIEDEYLTEDEETSINQALAILKLPESAIAEITKRHGNGILIARLNAGRLPVLAEPAVFLKPREVAHVQVAADLLKEVVHRETRGRTSGVSIPIGLGLRYRVGAYSGKSVVVGTSIEVADKGVLCLTSQRAVFKGSRQSVECAYAKLLGVNVFTDGIQFHVSNRKTATLLRVNDGHLVAAVVNTAMRLKGVSP